jgi:hypothetical protein
MHPALVQLHRWYGEGQLLVLHAVGSPYRERSHFDAQQMLESGGERPFLLSTGWLGRALQASPQGGVALTSAMPLALRGAEAASTWTATRSTGQRDDLLARVAELYRDDPVLRQAFARSWRSRAWPRRGGSDNSLVSLARQAGSFPGGVPMARAWPGSRPMAGTPTPSRPAGWPGCWPAWMQGWPRCGNRSAARLGPHDGAGDDGVRALGRLQRQWRHRPRHRWGGLLAGGAVAGGRVLTDWPGLAAAQLLDGRDLRPTLDLRSLLASVVQRQFGLEPELLARVCCRGRCRCSQGLRALPRDQALGARRRVPPDQQRQPGASRLQASGSGTGVSTSRREAGVPESSATR